MTATPAGGSAQLSRLPSQTSQSSTSSSGSVAGRVEGGGSGSRSQRKMSAPPPNVPRRTVSRLSSSEGLSPQTSRDGSATSQPSHNIQTTTCFLAASASSSPSNSTSKKSPSPGYLVSDVVDCRVPPATAHTLSSQVCSISCIVSSLFDSVAWTKKLVLLHIDNLDEHTIGFAGKTFSSAGTFSGCCLQPSPT